jgi:hypothetical protein
LVPFLGNKPRKEEERKWLEKEGAITNGKLQPQTCNYFSNKLFTASQTEQIAQVGGAWDV